MIYLVFYRFHLTAQYCSISGIQLKYFLYNKATVLAANQDFNLHWFENNISFVSYECLSDLETISRSFSTPKGMMDPIPKQ